MFKSKQYKELIGFDHTWFVLFAIVSTAFLFPIIFFGDTHEDFRRNFFYNAPVGIIYSSIIVCGNLWIYRTHKLKLLNSKIEAPNFKIPYFKHFIFTLIAGTILTHLVSFVEPGVWDFRRYAISAIGNLLLVSLMIGIYETAFYMKQLRESLEAQEVLKRQNVESQLEILKNQVKPHFLFNSLNTLTSLIPEEPNLAVEYVQKLSKVYRYILEIKDKKLIPLQEELDCIKAYLFMLKIRFGENLRTEIDETGLNFNHHIVPLSLQLLVENAVKHNVISNRKPLTIKIHKGKNGSLMVCNDLQKKSQVMPSTGTGLDNIKNRYKILANKEVDVIVTDNHFTVTLPLVEVS